MVIMQEKQENFLFEIECSIFHQSITCKSKDFPVGGFPKIVAPLSLFFRGSSQNKGGSISPFCQIPLVIVNMTNRRRLLGGQ